MKRYTVESVEIVGEDRFQMRFVSPQGHRVEFTEIRPGATLEEMKKRATAKCKKLDKMFGSEKHDHKHSAYRTVNRALLENRRSRDD